MKRLFIFFSSVLLTLSAYAQNDNLIWQMTVDVKMDKKLEWEKKVVAFAKAHYPDLKFRVWEVISGENSGKYVVAMGPTSFKNLDTPHKSPKGEAQMKTDGQALDALCNSTSANYYRVVNDLSSNKPDRKIKYQAVSYAEIEMGTWGEMHSLLKNFKEAREKGGVSVDEAVLRPQLSGAGNAYMTVTFMEKLEDLDGPGGILGGNLNEMYDKTFGNNAFYKAIQSYIGILKSNKSELRALRTDLSNL